MTAITIEYAGCRYRFAGMIPEQSEIARSYFEALVVSTGEEPDVAVTVEHVDDPARFTQLPRQPHAPVIDHLSVRHTAESILLDGIGFAATISRRALRATLQTCLTGEWFVYPFDNLFRVLACYKIFEQGGLVVHSAGLTYQHRGFLFCGRSGAGKSTLCGLADQLKLGILSDDLNAVVPDGGSFSLLAMPFAGDFGRAPTECARSSLAAVLGLEKSPTARLRDCSNAEAVARIVASSPFVNFDPQLADTLAARASELVAEVPFRILAFAKNTNFWKVLDDEYGDRNAQLSA